ncbi:biotin-dependent carboxyltransferase family protein [Cysteiniphilum halobium]|uniref:5-oxoprolinase subunit C family protein n=1 Tax=Cysteiniphilum halobium TaxID=2219059 RepID=UPI003F870A69
MFIEVLNPGMMTTIQDQGRNGYQQYGVIESGAMDKYAAKVANILVGNPENYAVLEVCITGIKVRFHANTIIAIYGALSVATINDIPIKHATMTHIQNGDVLQIKTLLAGNYAYIAVCGGFQIEDVLGSKSTYLRAKIGGFHGRALQAQDKIILNKVLDGSQLYSNENALRFNWQVSVREYFFSRNVALIRVMIGRQFDWFDDENNVRFFESTYTISPHSDRMGYRLQGAKIYQKNTKRQLTSEAVANGTIQIASDGLPIVLLADRQTVGGYPKIAHIISADLGVFAQLRVGQKLRFQKVSQENAQSAIIRQQNNLAKLKLARNYYDTKTIEKPNQR